MHSITTKGRKFLKSVWLWFNWNASSTIVCANSTSKLDVLLSDTKPDSISQFANDTSWC